MNDPRSLVCLGDYVTSVLNCDFEAKRNSLDQNTHLQTVNSAHPNLLEKWQQPLNSFKTDSINSADDEKFEGRMFKQWLQIKLVRDRHLLLNSLKQDNLIQYLTHEEGGLGEKHLSELQNQEILGQEEIDSFEFQKNCFHLFVAKENKEKIELLESIKKLCVQNLKAWSAEEFIRDIETLQKSLIGFQLMQSMTVVDSTDPIDILLSGTEISDSCQTINGSPNLNKGLLGYLMDGKNRILVVKDSEGRIVARCLLRLLWDGEKAVLYRERLYPFSLSKNHANALNKMAKQKAETLGLDLLGDSPNQKPYGKSIQSLGGPAPWEYCDAANGIQKESKFNIPSSYYL